MSKHNDEFTVPLSIKKTMKVCKEAAAELGWRIMNEGDNYISCKEVSPQIISFTWAAKIDVYVEGNNNESIISLNGSIFSMGPIQSGHLKGQLGKLKNLIQLSVNKHKSYSSQSSSSIVSELEKLSSLLSKGLLTEEEFNSAKKRILEQSVK